MFCGYGPDRMPHFFNPFIFTVHGFPAFTVKGNTDMAVGKNIVSVVDKTDASLGSGEYTLDIVLHSNRKSDDFRVKADRSV